MEEIFITLEMAKAMAVAAEIKAKAHRIHIVISIYDQHGNLKYFSRMDNTSYGSIRISQLKAKTAASMPVSSKNLFKIFLKEKLQMLRLP